MASYKLFKGKHKYKINAQILSKCVQKSIKILTIDFYNSLAVISLILYN